ncbi:MAG: hypothetical protein R6X02_22830 [Enhygromyxa sp.]
MSDEISNKYEIWQGPDLLHSADEFEAGDLFRIQQAQSHTIELRCRNGERAELIAYVIGESNELPALLKAHGQRVPKGPADVMLRQQVLRDSKGERFAWVLIIEISAEGVIKGCRQNLWVGDFDHVVMYVERSDEGDIVNIEKPFSPDAQHDFLITYDRDLGVTDIAEFIHDSDDYYLDDLMPMFDDPRFYTDAVALPSTLGPQARIPDLPPFPRN